MRKLKRASELQDKRDRIRMGLLPPDPPKGERFHPIQPYELVLMSYSSVGLKNLMKVLTSDAIQDPTRVEARVRREVAMRRHGHEKMNAERKLTDEQKREKKEMKKADQEKKGMYGAVFKYVFLSIFLCLSHNNIPPPESRSFPIQHTNSKCGRMQSNMV